MLRSLVPCKENQDILGFRISGTSMDSSLCRWNLDSGFQSLVGLRIPQAKISRIPEFGFHYTGREQEPITWREQLPCTRVFLERFFRESRISFKPHKPVSKTYRPKHDNFCLLMTLGFHF